jgi:hypothetical protein
MVYHENLLEANSVKCKIVLSNVFFSLYYAQNCIDHNFGLIEAWFAYTLENHGK